MAICCPKTFTGFCLEGDNTPIAITLDNGVIVSWTNLVTGVVTAGNPPADTGVCEVPSTVTVDIEPLSCAVDSVTVCPPEDDSPFHVIVDSSPPVTVSLDCATDSITICPGVDPIVVEGIVTLDVATLIALETITVNQGTSPWIVDGEVALDAATLLALETITVNQGTSPWVVSAVALDIRPLDCLTDSVEVCQGTSPWVVDGEVALDAATLVALETTTVNQGTSPWVVDGEVALDAATLVALETVTVLQGTSPWVVSGTVSVTEPVTVDGTVTLDAATLAALETVTVNQGTSPWVVSGTVSITEPVTIDAVDLDIRPLDCLTDSVTVCVVDPLPIDDPQANKRFQPGVRTTQGFPISALGDNVIITPAAGMRLRVTWIGMSSPDIGLETLAIVKFGAAGAAKYRWYMGAPGAFSHWEAIEGAANESLIVNLSIGTTVQVNVTFEEF